MTEAELSDALEGLFAYDTGSVDSGIRDESLRKRCVAHVESLPNAESRILLGRIARELCLSESALAAGYGLEDVIEFGRWVHDDNFGMG